LALRGRVPGLAAADVEEALVGVLIADVLVEVASARLGVEHGLDEVWGDVEVAQELAVVQLEVEPLGLGVVGQGDEHGGLEAEALAGDEGGHGGVLVVGSGQVASCDGVWTIRVHGGDCSTAGGDREVFDDRLLII
jgi:hypothetical protein